MAASWSMRSRRSPISTRAWAARSPMRISTPSAAWSPTSSATCPSPARKPCSADSSSASPARMRARCSSFWCGCMQTEQRRVLVRAFALWILILLPLLSFAQPQLTPEPGANLDVALVTFGPGEEIWERFGHNAILIRDRTTATQRLYNYGMFDFAQKNFFLNFARGRMLYRIAVDDPADEFPQYREEGRWIVEQDLNLTPAQRAKLRDYLDWNARPENAQYRYDYFTANCATRVRDALDAALGGAIHAQLIAPSR